HFTVNRIVESPCKIQRVISFKEILPVDYIYKRSLFHIHRKISRFYGALSPIKYYDLVSSQDIFIGTIQHDLILTQYFYASSKHRDSELVLRIEIVIIDQYHFFCSGKYIKIPIVGNIKISDIGIFTRAMTLAI